tara:strand:- start:94 stop:543 length:450 start_codon:yes stop_codon:yes gene_type:complete
MWFDILKDAKQISSAGIKTKLGTKPLSISDNDDKDDCCDKAIDSLEDFISDYIHYGNPPAVVRHALSWNKEFNKILKDSGSYNTWTFQEGLPNNAGGITEEGCEQFYNMLKRRLSPLWYEAYAKLSPQFKDMYDDGRKILDEWERCKNE